MAADRQKLRKAAVVLRSLPAEQRARLLAKLDASQAAAVTAEMNGLDPLRDGEQEAVVQEFSEANLQRPGKEKPTTATPFAFLHDFQTDDLLDLIADEQPQTIAMMLFWLPSRLAGDVLAALPHDRQLGVIRRIAAIRQTRPEIVRDLENALRRRMFGTADRPAESRGLARAVRILSAMKPATERRLLGELAEADPDLLREVRREMFGDDVAACGDWEMAEAAAS
jgi:flagellar motor switch protein FliG